MRDVYKNCPIYEDKDYTLRLIRPEGKVDLLKVYSDEKAMPFFDGGNCDGDDFHYTTENRVEQTIEYWLWEYNRQGFVHRTIVPKTAREVVGTIELFHREGGDYFTNCGLLRLNTRNDHEIQNGITQIPMLIIEPTYTLFHRNKIATKAIASATERVEALYILGFKPTDEKLVGHDGIKYDSYLVVRKNQQDFKSECVNKRTC